ncbi:MAG: ABC transporter ATP-binding protein [Saprospiraceae bacterium]|nr:ABC transporter ATP-binding protein [Saprospiraceae bacterium]
MSTHKLLLSAKNLCVDYSHHGLTTPIVQDFNLNIHEGETIAISGESGSGKSVSALSLMGLTGFYPGMSARGQVVIDGVNMLEENETGWANIRGKFISIVFQQALSALNPVLTIGNQLKEAIQIHQPDLSSQDIIIKAKALLNETGLTETDRMLRSYPHELSGGQLQRIVISMAIAHKPKIIIADEATSSLDEQTATEIIALLKRIQAKNGTALIIISHDFRQLTDVCDRLLIIHQGKVTDEISSDQIRSGNMTELSKAYILADQLLTKEMPRSRC